MSFKRELTKKVFGVPLFIILIGCMMIGGVIAQSVTFTFDVSGITHNQDPAPTGEETGSETFDVEEKIEWLTIETEVTGNAVLGSPGVLTKSYVTNSHPTESFTIELKHSYTMDGAASPFVSRVSDSHVVGPGEIVEFYDNTYVALPTSGVCTLEVSFYSLTLN